MSAVHSLAIGSGPIPIVFVHGLFGQGRNWLGIARRLADDATCLLIDAPNHGRSAWTSTFDYDAFAESVHDEILRHPAFSHGFILVGHSMGGKLAMRLALSHPDAVRLLSIVDISPVSRPVGPEFGTIVTALRNLDLGTLSARSEAADRLSQMIPDRTIRDFLLQNLQHLRGHDPQWAWRMNLELLGDSLDLIGDWKPTSAHFNGPVLWLAGERSSYVLPEHIPATRELFPRAVLVSIKGAGHWVHSEQPEAFLAALRAFISLNYRP